MVAAAKKGKAEVRVVVAEDVSEKVDALTEQVEGLTSVVSQLLEALTVKEEGKPRRVSPTPALRRQQLLEAGKKGRQGKWAKRMGITREEFLQRYGDTDKPPEDMPSIPYRKK
jgi:hypothetical protein